MNLHRTQIYMQEHQIKKLKQEAQKGQSSVSELIRKAINSFLQTKESSVNWKADPLSKAIGKIKLNASDSSVNHDKYLYR